MTTTNDTVRQEIAEQFDNLPAEDAAQTSAATDASDPAADATPTEPDSGEQPDTGNKEAAKYRRQLRVAEKERDTLAGRVEALQRTQIESLCEQAHVKPAALWSVAELAALVAEDGTVDAAAVAAAIGQARDTLGIAPIGKGAAAPGAGRTPSSPPSGNQWADAFKPKNSRSR